MYPTNRPPLPPPPPSSDRDRPGGPEAASSPGAGGGGGGGAEVLVWGALLTCTVRHGFLFLILSLESETGQ